MVEPVLTFTSEPAPCEYLPDRSARLRYEISPALTAEEYMERLRAGWRRFGPIVFRPECDACRMCQSLRVPVATFRPTESQRRAWRKNAGDVTLDVGAPGVSPEKKDLLTRFHRHGQETKGWPESANRMQLFVTNPFPTEEWRYHSGGRLIGVGYVDVLAEGLSAIYFFWDPVEHSRSLGTFNILTLIEAARDRDLPYVYLGYFVAGCRSLEYKARFAPNEVLGPEGRWERFIG